MTGGWLYWLCVLVMFVMIGPFPLWAVWYDARRRD
jgi:hypothetical protein